jgi:hypothetical protein
MTKERGILGPGVTFDNIVTSIKRASRCGNCVMQGFLPPEIMAEVVIIEQKAEEFENDLRMKSRIRRMKREKRKVVDYPVC